MITYSEEEVEAAQEEAAAAQAQAAAPIEVFTPLVLILVSGGTVEVASIGNVRAFVVNVDLIDEEGDVDLIRAFIEEVEAIPVEFLDLQVVRDKLQEAHKKLKDAARHD